VERKKIESIIESLLFVAGEPLSLKRICDVISGAEQVEVEEALNQLVQRYEGEERGLRMVEVAGGYQFQTDPDHAGWVGRLLQSRPVRLSRASLETLAIAAYKQPVTRAEVEDIRGVDCGGVLKTLLEHGFIRIAGRMDAPGKPLIYTTDKRFMEFFRLKSLSELPTLKELADIQEERITEAERQGELPLEDPSGADEEIPPEEQKTDNQGEDQAASPEQGSNDNSHEPSVPGEEQND